MERSYSNPYRHWRSGFLLEVAVFVGFLVTLAVLAFVVARLAG